MFDCGGGLWLAVIFAVIFGAEKCTFFTSLYVPADPTGPEYREATCIYCDATVSFLAELKSTGGKGEKAVQ
ncbi:MAG: hypothetical protein M3O09_07175, partial [Acidobacteriota bacterium]|nr:hypothetical protein [Acidobacteriota bacterium]